MYTTSVNSIIFGVSLAALLSTTSLLIVLFRISPLLAPEQAIPAFFISVLLSVSSTGALLFMLLWKYVPHHDWDLGRLTTISLRQGIFLGSATGIVLLFHILGLLNWWIALLIFSVFVLVELAMKH